MQFSTLVEVASTRKPHVLQPRLSITFGTTESFTTTSNGTPVVDSSFTFDSFTDTAITVVDASTPTLSVNTASPFTAITPSETRVTQTSGSSSIFSPSTTARPASSPSVDPTSSASTATSRGLSTGAIAGIAVIVGVGASLGTALAFYIYMKKRARSYGNRINIVGTPLFFKS